MVKKKGKHPLAHLGCVTYDEMTPEHKKRYDKVIADIDREKVKRLKRRRAEYKAEEQRLANFRAWFRPFLGFICLFLILIFIAIW